MNYSIEGNIDFYKELLESVCKNTLNNKNDEENKNNNICLITHESLDTDFITLDCNHKFNYFPLFNEIKKQKSVNYINHLETTHLKLNEIKCPYCRQIQPKLLPYIPKYGSETLIKGVTKPEKYSMYRMQCPHIIKYGKRKGEKCGKNCSKLLGFCSIHIKSINRKKQKENDNDINFCKFENTKIEKDKSKKDNSANEIKIHLIKKISNNLVVNCGCQQELKFGKRKGEKCETTIFDKKTQLCKRHYNLQNNKKEKNKALKI